VTREDRKSEDDDTTEIGQGNSGSLPNLQYKQVVPSTDIPVAERPVSAQKGIDKILCFRCENNGHYAQACTAVLCIYCEKASHLSKDCPLLALPKPTAITYGLCRPQLMFNKVPASSDICFKHDSGKVGRISVEEGVMSAAEIVKELEWIVPGDH
jgi:hypothetical protein